MVSELYLFEYEMIMKSPPFPKFPSKPRLMFSCERECVCLILQQWYHTFYHTSYMTHKSSIDTLLQMRLCYYIVNMMDVTFEQSRPQASSEQ